jgi:hypothetical protein
VPDSRVCALADNDVLRLSVNSTVHAQPEISADKISRVGIANFHDV